MANNQIVSKISKNVTDVVSDCSNPKNNTTETNDGYRGPGRSRSRLRQMINVSNPCRIPPGFKNTYGVPNRIRDIRVTAHGTNNTVPKKITSFKDSIHKSLLVNMSELNYKKPTLIQKYVLPIIMDGWDLIAGTQAGSGKTTAFVISILNRLLNNLPEINRKIQRCDPLAVIVVPKKISVKLMYNFISKLSRGTSIICRPMHAIESVNGNKTNIKHGAHVIVATPESLASYVSGGWVTFTALRIVVFDEVDLMLKMGFKPEIEFILNNKTMVSTDTRSTAMFSTTLPTDVTQLAMTYLKSNYVSLYLSVDGMPTYHD